MEELLSQIKGWKEDIMTNSSKIREAEPIAVQVSRMGTKNPVPFHFTQCFATALPPLQILILLSNILVPLGPSISPHSSLEPS